MVLNREKKILYGEKSCVVIFILVSSYLLLLLLLLFICDSCCVLLFTMWTQVKNCTGAAEQPYNQKVNQELILNLVQSLEFTSYYDWKYILQDGRPRTFTMYRWWCARVLVFSVDVSRSLTRLLLPTHSRTHSLRFSRFIVSWFCVCAQVCVCCCCCWANALVFGRGA